MTIKIPMPRWVFFLSLPLSAMLLIGCAIFPMKTRTVGSTGAEKPLDLDFIQANKTTRDEVARKLAWMDTGLKHSRLFWGRWYQSSSGVLFVPGPLAMSDFTARRWHDRNLLVEFNGHGTVERSGKYSNAQLNEELDRWLNGVGEPPLDLSVPLVIEMQTGSKRMTLTRDSVEFVLWDGAIFDVPRKDIFKLETPEIWAPGVSGSAPRDIAVLFHFSHEKPGKQGCKCLRVDVSPADYLTLLRYISQTVTVTLY
jgi:hypothetical protein